MTVQLLIKEEVIEEIEIDISECKCYEERKEKITEASNWLKYKYSRSIVLIDNWEIISVTESIKILVELT